MKLKFCIAVINITLRLFFIRLGVKFKSGTDFSYVQNNKTVYWSLLVVSNYDDLFRKMLVDELGLNYNCDIFLLSLMHEIGHHMTIESLADEDLDYSIGCKTRIENKKRQTKKDYLEYFHLPDEWAASEWAVNYIHNHPKKMKRLWSIIKKEIMFLYRINNVETDA